ncbi:MAG: DNA repair protein RecN [Bacteroidaceae bacterium]|nr:DNA repair protein RecN [Bacteroidaceae bacterium]
MIRSLHIEHYALIDQLDISWHSGFSVITGETGAGKSIILGAIGLLLGERMKGQPLPPPSPQGEGAQGGEKSSSRSKCVIEAEFELSDELADEDFFLQKDLDFDGRHCIIRRELTAEGKSRAFINDTPVNLSLLKEIGGQLIDIHSQHQNLLLGKEDFQLNTLDILAHDAEELKDYCGRYSHYLTTRQQLQETKERAQSSHEQEDYLRFQANQLAEAALREEEQEELEAEQEMLSHAEEIKEGLYEAQSCLNADEEGNTLQRIKQAVASLQNVNRVFSQMEELTQRLDSCYIELKDIADEIGQKADEVEYDPQRLEQVNERLDTLYSLQKKHHVDSVAELIALQKELEQQLALIDNSEEHIAALERELNAAKEAVLVQARKLTEMRQGAKKVLEQDIVSRLVALGMPNVRFEVNLTQTAEPGWKGMDKVEFLFSANKNVPTQPLSQIASGGEIARVMLSLKALIANAVKLPTIIFDEIDTGVSGKIAEQMALMMQEMGEQGCQVVSITHLPQIAAKGQHHYKVYKEEGANATLTHITELTEAQRIEEIAHMLSGATLTEAALNNAKELLKQ